MSSASPWTWLVAAAVAIGLGALFGGLAVAGRRWRLPAEVARKAAHVGVGLIAVSFAWLFADIEPVLVLCGGGLLLMLLARWWGPMNRTVGAVLYGVDRESWGELCIPLVVPLLHGLAMPSRALYVIPLLILGLGDAAAALIGRRFGKLTYRTDEGFKTVEGSLALAGLTAATVIMVLSIAGIPLERSIAAAVMIALLITLAEAIAWRGLDNLIVPLGSFALLRIYLELPLDLLVVRVVVAIAITAGAIALQRRAPIIASAGLASALLVYASWAIGGWMWMIAPVAFLVVLPMLGMRSSGKDEIEHGVGVVLSLSAPPLTWMFTGALTEHADLFAPYITSCAAATGVVGVVRRRYDLRRGRRDRLHWPKIVTLLAIVVLPLALADGASPRHLLEATAVVIAAGLAAIATLLSPLERPNQAEGPRWLARTAMIGVVSLLGLIPRLVT